MSLESLATIFGLAPPNASRQLTLSCARCLSQITISEQDRRTRFTCAGGCTEDELIGALAEVEPKFAAWWLSGGLQDTTPEPLERPESHDSEEDGSAAAETQMPRQGERPDEASVLNEEKNENGSEDTEPHLNGQVERLDRNPVTPLRQTAMDDILRRVPPQDVTAEQSLLGAILLEPSIMSEVARVMVASDFYKESHREIYKAMLRASDAQNEIDPVTLAHDLRKHGLFEAIGGGSYLAELADVVPTSLNFARYAEIVKECAIKRDVIRAAAQLMEQAYDGSSLLSLAEAARRVAPVQATGGLPQLISRDLEIISGRLFAERQSKVRREWIIEGFLARKEISLWSGKVEAGKTTLMRTLVMCVLRGELFLERHVYPGRVLYVMLDADGPDLTFELFGKLGIDWNVDAIDFLIDPVMCFRPNAFAQFHAKLLQLRPSLVVIDPIGRFQKVEESEGGFNGYGMTYAMAQFSELAKQTNCHMTLLHHIPRGRSDADDPATAGFGSIAIAGGCNARFICLHKTGDIYTVKTSKGKGGGFMPFDGEMTLTKDPVSEWVTLAGVYSFKDQARACKELVRELVQNSEREWTSDSIGRELKLQRSVAGLAAKLAADEGRLKFRQEGKRFIFSALEGPSVN